MPAFAHANEMTDAATVPRTSLQQTIVGMAHFAGTGPGGTACGECIHWQSNKLKPAKQICEQCGRMTGDRRKQIDAGRASCRYFEARPKA